MSAVESFSRDPLPRGLRVLILLRYKAALRRLVFGNAKRQLFTFLGLGLMAVYVLPNLFFARKSFFSADIIRLWLPFFLVIFVFMQMLGRIRREPVIFQPAELDLVVPGPFSRRQLVLYQILYQVAPMLLLGFWLAIFMRGGGSYLSAAIGIAQLFFAINLLSGIFNSGLSLLHARSKFIVPVLAVAVCGLLAYVIRNAPPPPAGMDLPLWKQWASDIRHLPLVDALCLPAKPYAEALASPTVAAALPWAGVALLMNLVFIALFIALDRGEVEALLVSSQKQLARIEQAKRRGRGLGDLEEAAGRTVPMLPRLAGAGPLVWRQLTMAQRGLGRTALVGVLLLIVIGGAATGYYAPPDVVELIMVVSGFGASLMLSWILACDFRSDIDHMPMLKTLPLPALTIVLGQVTTPVLIAAAVQCLLGVSIALGAATPRHALIGLAIAVAALPLSMVLVTIENTLYLMAPVRKPASAMPSGIDPARLGRGIIIMLTKFIVTGLALVVIGGPAVLAFNLGGPFAAFAVALLIAFGLIYGLVLLCVLAFERFNVADDQPV